MTCELNCVDQLQRANYLKLAMEGRDRHNDIAYGLSEKLLWSEKETVIRKLIDMGKRNYDEAIPKSHEKENGVLHVAVSYKHTSLYQNGTINNTQAIAIWEAVRSLPNVAEDTRVRV